MEAERTPGIGLVDEESSCIIRKDGEPEYTVLPYRETDQGCLRR